MANNRHPAVAHLVEQMRQQSKNEKEQDTHMERSINMRNRDAAREHLLNIVTGNTKEDRTNAITNLLKLSDSSTTREQVERSLAKPSAGQRLAQLTNTELRDH